MAYDRAVEFILILAYAAGAIGGAVGAKLYYGAYRQMKRTRIILATHTLLGAIAIDTTWWFFTEFLRFMDPAKEYPLLLVNPPLMLVPKLLLASAVWFFVMASVSDPDPCTK